MGANISIFNGIGVPASTNKTSYLINQPSSSQYPGSFYAISNGIASKFQSSANSNPLGYINLYLVKDALATGSVQGKIYSDSNGLPGSAIASGSFSIDAATLPLLDAPSSLELSLVGPLSSSTFYWLVLAASVTPSSDQIYIYCADSPATAQFASFNNNVWSTQNNRAIYFLLKSASGVAGTFHSDSDTAISASSDAGTALYAASNAGLILDCDGKLQVKSDGTIIVTNLSGALISPDGSEIKGYLPDPTSTNPQVVLYTNGTYSWQDLANPAPLSNQIAELSTSKASAGNNSDIKSLQSLASLVVQMNPPGALSYSQGGYANGKLTASTSSVTSTYYYSLTAIDSKGNETGGSPELKIIMNVDANGATLSWNAVPHATGGYKLYRGTQTTVYGGYYTIPVGTTTYIDLGNNFNGAGTIPPASATVCQFEKDNSQISDDINIFDCEVNITNGRIISGNNQILIQPGTPPTNSQSPGLFNTVVFGYDAIYYCTPSGWKKSNFTLVGVTQASDAPNIVSTFQSNITSNGGSNLSSSLVTYLSNTYVYNLINAGIWDLLDEVIIPVGSDLNTAATKLKFVSNSACTNHGFVSADYSQATGFQGGSGKYLDPGFSFSNFLNNSGYLAAYTTGNFAGDTAALISTAEIYDSNSPRIYPGYQGNFYGAILSTSYGMSVPSTGGFLAVSRTDANNLYLQVNSNQVAQQSPTVQTSSNDTAVIGRETYSDRSVYYSQSIKSVYFGQGLTQAQSTSLYQIDLALQTYLSRN